MAARESPRMIEEESERTETHSSSGGAQECVRMPLPAQGLRYLNFRFTEF
jgi:hypothetical protein